MTASINSLPTETLLHILKELDEPSLRRSLVPMSEVSRLFRRLSQQLLFQKVIINTCKESAAWEAHSGSRYTVELRVNVAGSMFPFRDWFWRGLGFPGSDYDRSNKPLQVLELVGLEKSDSQLITKEFYELQRLKSKL